MHDPVLVRQLQPKVPARPGNDLPPLFVQAAGQAVRQRKELAKDLRRFREGRPIKARPVGLPSRVWRSCRRNPILAGLIAALVLVVSVGGGVVVNLSLQATESERRALANEKNAVEGRRQAEAAQQEAEEQHVATVRLLAKVARIAYATPVENPDQGLTLDLLLEVEAQYRNLLAKRPEDVDLLLALGSVCLEQAMRHSAHRQPDIRPCEASRCGLRSYASRCCVCGRPLHRMTSPSLNCCVDLADAQWLAQEPDAALSSAKRAAAFAAHTAQSPSRDQNTGSNWRDSCMALGHHPSWAWELSVKRYRNSKLPGNSMRPRPRHPENSGTSLDCVTCAMNSARSGGNWNNTTTRWRPFGRLSRHSGRRSTVRPKRPAHRQQLSHFYERLAYWLRQRGCLAEASACYLEQKKLWPGNAKQLLEISGNLAELAKEVGGGRMELTPTEQEERKRYLDLSEQAAKEAGWQAVQFQGDETVTKTTPLLRFVQP